MQLILLSAGRGSRLSKELRSKPKSLTKVNDIPIIEYNLKFFNKFKKKFLITGYKKRSLESFAKKNNFKIIHNKEFQKTNMVYSMFLPSKYVNDDVVICYGDIIFDYKIYDLLNKRDNIIPLNVNWLKIWKKRMSKKNIKNDAESLTVKNDVLLSIGGKIEKSFPKYQYMGIFKLKKLKYFFLKKFFIKINKPKIDMTNFLNLSIKNCNLNFKIEKYKSYWYEIDNKRDLIISSKELNNKSFMS